MVALTALAGIAAAGSADAPGNGGLSVGLSQGAGNATVPVSNSTDGTPVANATVRITSTNGSAYDVAGGTNEDGVVAFPSPDEATDVTITVVKDGTTGETTATLRAGEGGGPGFLPFGQQVASYVHGLLGSVLPGPIGQLVAGFATSNAGTNAPVNPPAAGTSASVGPPEDAGKPDDAGKSENGDETESQKEEDGNSSGNGGGLPDDAGR